MVVAWAHPHIEAAWKAIDSLPDARRLSVRAAIVAATATAGYVWYTQVYSLPKLEYNAVHPYTSWIPLTLWIVVRNITPGLRSHSLAVFGWLGCVTLETYIGQFHIWLRSNIPNGQPKWILDVVRPHSLRDACRRYMAEHDAVALMMLVQCQSWRPVSWCCRLLGHA